MFVPVESLPLKSLCTLGCCLVAFNVGVARAAPATRGEVRVHGSPVVTPVPDVERDSGPKIGAMFDVGVPDGAALSLAYRPFYWVHLFAGGTYNSLAQGIRGGVTVAAFDYGITPTLTGEVGYYFASDISEIIAQLVGEDIDSSLFNKMAYSYMNGHVGLILGGDYFQFFVRGGMSYIKASFSGGEFSFDEQSSLSVARGAQMDVWSPSAKLGFSLYFF